MAGLAHIGVGFALKWAAPRAPVVALIAAAEALDLLSIPLLVVQAGAEALSLTHGLFMACIWTAAAIGAAFALRCDARTSLVIGLSVFSHWILDYITHPMGAVFGGKPLPPDLPLLFGASPKVGLGLYNSSYSLAIAFDLGLTVAGVAAYIVYRRRRTPMGALRAED